MLRPSLPYIRAVEHISYLVGALHQVAFAVGGGLAGLLAANQRRSTHRAAIIAGGLVGAALLTAAAAGQIVGPLTAGAIAQGAGLRIGLLVLPALIVIAAAGLYRHPRVRTA